MTFFSGTDQSTLVEEGTNANHFLSLIVNNAGLYTAGITRKVVTECKAEAHIKYTESKYYDSYGGNRVMLEQDTTREEDKEETKNNEVIEWFELNIIKEEAPNNFNDIDVRLAEIRKSRKVCNSYTKYISQTQKPKPDQVGPTYPTNNHSSYNYPSYDTGYPRYPYNRDYPNMDDEDGDDGYTGSIFPSPSQSKEPKGTEDKPAESTTAAEFPLCLQESFDENLINQLCIQLLTGSIIVNEKSITLDKWVKKMDHIYEKRFGLLDKEEHPLASDELLAENNARLKEWISSMVEFLVFTKDSQLLDRLNLALADGDNLFDESDTAEVCAFDMYQTLYSLPASYVKEKMMLVLETYIPNGAFDYTTFE